MRRRITSTPGSPGTQLASKGCRSTFFGVFALFGVLIAVAVVAGLAGTVKTRFWEETSCTIIESRHSEAADKGKDFVLRYRYRAAGRERTSDQFTAGIKESLDAAKIEKLLLNHPVNSQARCYVNPKNPDEAVLKRGSLWVGLILLFPLIFLAVGIGGIVTTWRQPRSATAVSHRARATAVAKFAPWILFGVFTLVGGVAFYFITIRTMLLYLDARSWLEVPCEIVSSSVGSHHSSGKNKSTTYSADIVYRYKMDGREYRADRYGLFDGSSSGRSNKAAIVARYRPGAKAVCFVDPENPSEALLDRGLNAFMLLGLIPAVFLLIGLGGLVGMLRSLVRASGTVAGGISQPVLPGAAPVLPGATPVVPGAVAVGPAVLTPSASPAVKFFGAVFFALFWNGITSIFVTMAVKSWIAKRPEILLSIFMIPFVLIGLVIIGFAVAMFLNLFNPRIALSVSSQSVPLGGTLDVRWNFRGTVGRIRRLSIVLEGREEASYRRGTTTSTDRAVFARLQIAETDQPQQIREGAAQITVPEGLMHTWDGGSNKIAWQLKVRGEIARYPDVDEDFNFTILPHSR